MRTLTVVSALGLAAALSTSALAAEPKADGRATAIFAGGCFWCMEGPFEKLPGVLSVTSGYTDGQKKNPTYDEVSSGGTGHTEAVQIVFEPAKISYEKLLQVFWVNIDPLQANAQFCDRGSQYRSGIYYLDDAQKAAALASRKTLEDSGRFKGRPIVTEIEPASHFYPAEEYHQDYYKKNPVRYMTYRTGCGRDRRLKELWGDLAGGEK